MTLEALVVVVSGPGQDLLSRVARGLPELRDEVVVELLLSHEREEVGRALGVGLVEPITAWP